MYSSDLVIAFLREPRVLTAVFIKIAAFSIPLLVTNNKVQNSGYSRLCITCVKILIKQLLKNMQNCIDPKLVHI